MCAIVRSLLVLRAKLQHKSDTEDLLTSSVLARMSYLHRDALHRVFDGATEPLLDLRLPRMVGAVRWSFWPALPRAAADATHSQFVEPDVLVTSKDVTWVIECKHRGAQYQAQWRAQLLAVRARRGSEGQVALIAAGGLFDVAGARVWARALREECGAIAFCSMPWHRLGYALSAERTLADREGDDARYAVCDDALAALRHFDHGRQWLGTLPDLGSLHGAALPRWK